MTFRLAKALINAGHDVTVHPTIHTGISGVFDGVPTRPDPLPTDADVIICHADYGVRARRINRLSGTPIVAVCHNTTTAVKLGLINTRPALTVVNSAAMADTLGAPDALIVNPPAPKPARTSAGHHVTTMSLNELKGGPQFWAIADTLPDVEFLAVQGGYGQQILHDAANVQLLPHLPPHELPRQVWRHTGVFLQLAETESWGMAAAEALAHGIPVIAHETPGIRENLRDAAIYVDRDDAAGIAHAINMIRSNPEPFRQAARTQAAANHAASTRQLADWVTHIERLGRR